MLLFPILMELNLIVSALFPVPKAPCCLESLGVHACYGMRNRDPVRFQTRCTSEADFAILQCCHTCGTSISEFGAYIFKNGTESPQCFDRAICSPKSCPSTVIAFRTCRKSCGFCDPEIYSMTAMQAICPFIG